ncbi:hypothetical protein [Paenibacillus sp. FSL R5-808]|uniref:hypothetical protein n=1 Tax=Paenibacillus sp. FSL R5-808 TaxID=1227076 RepID=UPI0003E1D16A|nr:hypothetical protein [Paenibacillus sp. FSL R5-808]ETT33287.1 hypothetical protein C169_22865 [Paenibacillus sp. FSL R5-808]
MSTVWDIDAWVEEAAWSPIKRFYPTAVTKNVALPINLVFEHLLKLTEQGKLSLFWEIRCPSCFYTVIPNEDEEFNSGDLITCPLGHDFELMGENLFPVFEVNSEYRQYIRGKKKSPLQVMIRRKLVSAGL